jgi:uncharacterized membrane protein YjfL (UPF0719 family)
MAIGGQPTGRVIATLKATQKEGALMEYAILAAVGAMMLLYAVIIVECLRNREWR